MKRATNIICVILILLGSFSFIGLGFAPTIAITLALFVPIIPLAILVLIANNVSGNTKIIFKFLFFLLLGGVLVYILRFWYLAFFGTQLL
jgi:uncharacterized membrane protein